MTVSPTGMGSLLSGVVAVSLYLCLARPWVSLVNDSRKNSLLWSGLTGCVLCLGIGCLIAIPLLESIPAAIDSSPAPQAGAFHIPDNLSQKLAFAGLAILSCLTAAAAVLSLQPADCGRWLIGHLFCNAAICLVVGFSAGFVSCVIFTATAGLPVLILSHACPSPTDESARPPYEPAVACFAVGLWLMLWLGTISPPTDPTVQHARIDDRVQGLQAANVSPPAMPEDATRPASPADNFALRLLATHSPAIALLLATFVVAAVGALKLVGQLPGAEGSPSRVSQSRVSRLKALPGDNDV